MTPAIDPTAARVLRDFPHTSPGVGCRFDPAGRFVFTSSQDSLIHRYDLFTGAKVKLEGHKSWVRGMAFVPSKEVLAKDAAKIESHFLTLPAVVGTAAPAFDVPKPLPFSLVSADYHGHLIWWDGAADAPKPLRTVKAHEGWIRAVAVSPDRKTLASCGNDNAVKLWSMEGKPLKTLEGHKSHVYNVAFHPEGKRLVSLDLHGIAKDWDLKTFESTRELDAKSLHKYDTQFLADIGGARGIAFSPEGTLACCGITNVSNAFAGIGNPAVILFDWAEGKPKLLKTKEAFQGTAWGVGFLPDKFLVAAGGGSGGRLWFWKEDDLTSVHAVNLPSNARDLAIHPSGNRLAVALANGTTSVYTLTPKSTK